MEPFAIETARAGKVLVLRTVGYLDADGGTALIRAVEQGCGEGFHAFVLDFARSPVINSQGATRLLEVVELVLDKRKGKIAFSGLSDLAKTFLQMVGLFMRVQHHPDETTALDRLA